jgi:hypothetical protein
MKLPAISETWRARSGGGGPNQSNKQNQNQNQTTAHETLPTQQSKTHKLRHKKAISPPQQPASKTLTKTLTIEN